MRVNLTHAVEFLLAVSGILRPDFAYLHLFTEEQFSAIPYNMYSPFRQRGVATLLLRRYLPDLCWGTVFGPPYVRLFGRDVLLSAPVYRAQEIAQDTIYLQLSESLADLQTQYPAVDAVRQATKEHLGTDAFLNMELGQYHTYRTPEFAFSP